jgi:hypothetical protein
MLVRSTQKFEATQWFKLGDHPAVQELPDSDPLKAVDGGDGLGAVYPFGDDWHEVVQSGDYVMENLDDGVIFIVTSNEFNTLYEAV